MHILNRALNHTFSWIIVWRANSGNTKIFLKANEISLATEKGRSVWRLADVLINDHYVQSCGNICWSDVQLIFFLVLGPWNFISE